MRTYCDYLGAVINNQWTFLLWVTFFFLFFAIIVSAQLGMLKCANKYKNLYLKIMECIQMMANYITCEHETIVQKSSDQSDQERMIAIEYLKWTKEKLHERSSIFECWAIEHARKITKSLLRAINFQVGLLLSRQKHETK